VGGAKDSLHAEGSAEVRDLRWGAHDEIGHLRAGFVVRPDCWRVGNLQGSLWGSPIHGDVWRECGGREPAQYSLTLRLERASLSRIFAFQPDLERRFSGFVSFHAEGRSAGKLRGRGEVRVEQGQIHHVPIEGLSIPLDWDLRPEEDFEGTVRVRKAQARLAGGRIQSEATVRLGRRREIQTQLVLEQIDMQTISQAESRVGQPMPGRIDGIITLRSPYLARTHDYTGKIELVLTKAALVDIPILEELDKTLGSAHGAVFVEGVLHAQVAQGEIHVEALTLVGPLAQLHARGSIGFDGRLDLIAFVNTNDALPGEARVAIGRLSESAAGIRLEGQAIEQMTDLLSSSLRKYRVSGTLAHPRYVRDGSIHVGRDVLAFFLEAIRLARSGAFR
jgi:hypothetical protein